MEIEAKFALPDLETLHRLKEAESLCGFELTPGRAEQIRDTYLDTADWRLLASGYACRKREKPDGMLVTLKRLRVSTGAVHRREELEALLTEDSPAHEWPRGRLRDQLVALVAHEPLRPLFAFDQRRHVRGVHCSGRLVAEWSLDQVEMVAGGETRLFLGLEVELREEGTEDDLAQIVECLRAEWKLQPDPLSKFERALRFFGARAAPGRLLSGPERITLLQIASGANRFSRRALALVALDDGSIQKEAGRIAHLSDRSVRYWLARFRRERLGIFPSKALAAIAQEPPASEPRGASADMAQEPGALTDEVHAQAPGMKLPKTKLRSKPGLKAEDSMAEAARKTFRFHLQRMMYHEPGTRQGADIEELHDMRVATRRMRAAMRVFGDYLDPLQMRPFLKGMRRTGRALGAVRDLDVFQEKVQRYLQTLPASRRQDLDPLLASWEAQREEARKRMVAYLDSERYVRFKEGFAEFLEKPGAGGLPVLLEGGEPVPYELRHVVPLVVYERVAAVRAYEPWMDSPQIPLERLHQLRIASKALRYALEFFREVLGGEAKGLIDTIKMVQDHLGDLQDAVVACNLLRDFLTWGTWGHDESQRATWPSEPIVVPGVATYLAVRQTEIQELVGGFLLVWSEVQSVGFHQQLEGALAALW